MDVKEGKIAFLGKGFGFIQIQGRKKDLFFHARGLVDAIFEDLQVGDKVTFEDIQDSDKGSAAVGVRLA